MDLRHSFVTIVLLTCVNVNQGRVRYDGYRLLRVVPSTTEDAQLLRSLEMSGIDFWTAIHIGNPTEFLVPPTRFKEIYSILRDWKITIVNDNIQRSIESTTRHDDQGPVSSSVLGQRLKRSDGDVFSVVEKYARHHEINSWLHGMARRHPNVTEIIDIGQTFEGRHMLVIKIGNKTAVGKRAIWLDAGIHGREWIAPATLVYIISKLLTTYKEDERTRVLINTYDWYILPVVNADGYEYTHTEERLWRKTRRPTTTEDCIGTDGNRNFDHFWAANFSTSSFSHACSLTYSGDFAFSENCTRNMASFVFNMREDIDLFISFHSYSQLILLPWGFTTDLPPNYYDLMRVGYLAAKAIQSVTGREYVFGSASQVLYPSTGSSLDWAYGVAGIDYVYTIELFPQYSHDRPMSSGFLTMDSDIKPSGEEMWAAVCEMACAIHNTCDVGSYSKTEEVQESGCTGTGCYESPSTETNLKTFNSANRLSFCLVSMMLGLLTLV